MAAFTSSLLISQYEVKRTQALSRDMTLTDTFTLSPDFTVASRCMNSWADILVLSKYTMRMLDWTDGRSTRNVSHLASDIAEVKFIQTYVFWIPRRAHKINQTNMMMLETRFHKHVCLPVLYLTFLVRQKLLVFYYFGL